MPRFQDPALHTPERCRAVSSLWRLGGGLFLIAALYFIDIILNVANDWASINHWTIVGFLTMYALPLLPPAIGSALAIMAGIGICQGRWWSRMACRLTLGISSLYLGVVLAAVAAIWLLGQMVAHVYIVAILFVGCVFLLGMAMVRCIQFSKDERRRQTKETAYRRTPASRTPG